MSIVRFVCLANSFKEGGRCIAGIIVDENNNPVLENDNPKWIRPICDTTHKEIPTDLVNNINTLDIVEIEVSDYPDLDNYQSENALFKEESITVIGQYEEEDLKCFCSSEDLVFGNRGKAIAKDDIENHNHSLMYVSVNDYEVYQKTYEGKRHLQTRVKFTYKGNQYDLPITDPVFLQNYQSNPEFVKDYLRIDMTLSIGVEHNEWHSKLVAGIILP